MKIATWNLVRLRHKNSLEEIVHACERIQADILILTETDERIRPSFRHCFQTPNPAETAPGRYGPAENRVSVFTDYKCIGFHPTYDRYTALCVELETELGNLCVYGTIMGVEGNRRASFREDLSGQVKDFARLSAAGKHLCVGGDFNVSFCDNYYFTNYGRDTLLRSFSENRIRLLTENVPECIDHIAVSETFFKNGDVKIEEWNLEKKLSDHKGIAVRLSV